MHLAGQRIQTDRYAVIPRTLSFLLHNDNVLLIQVAANRGAWAGLYNGIGGHLEQGEDPLSGVRREIYEETGLSADDLRLCGVVVIDTNQFPGIALYIYVGQVISTEEFRRSLPQNDEGSLEWVPLDAISSLPLVEDLPQLIPQALDSYHGKPSFSALYQYDASGVLRITFGQ